MKAYANMLVNHLSYILINRIHADDEHFVDLNASGSEEIIPSESLIIVNEEEGEGPNVDQQDNNEGSYV